MPCTLLGLRGCRPVHSLPESGIVLSDGTFVDFVRASVALDRSGSPQRGGPDAFWSGAGRSPVSSVDNLYSPSEGSLRGPAPVTRAGLDELQTCPCAPSKVFRIHTLPTPDEIAWRFRASRPGCGSDAPPPQFGWKGAARTRPGHVACPLAARAASNTRKAGTRCPQPASPCVPGALCVKIREPMS